MTYCSHNVPFEIRCSYCVLEGLRAHEKEQQSKISQEAMDPYELLEMILDDLKEGSLKCVAPQMYVDEIRATLKNRYTRK